MRSSMITEYQKRCMPSALAFLATLALGLMMEQLSINALKAWLQQFVLTGSSYITFSNT